jgi:hypothetical protein
MHTRRHNGIQITRKILLIQFFRFILATDDFLTFYFFIWIFFKININQIPPKKTKAFKEIISTI